MGFYVLSQRMYFIYILVAITSLFEFSSPNTNLQTDSGLCPRSWEKAYIYEDTIGSATVCLKYFDISATWDEASIKCKSENSNILPPMLEIRNAFSFTFAFRSGVKLWSGLHVRGGGLIVESFPPYTVHAGIFDEITLLSDGSDLNLKCIVFESGSENMQYTLRNCSDATAFYCFAPIHQFSAFQELHPPSEQSLNIFPLRNPNCITYWTATALSFCPYKYVGDFYFPKCYRYVDNETSLHQAKQQCSTNGALAKFNTSDPIDAMIAVTLLKSAVADKKVWFQNLETTECSLLNMNHHNGSLWEMASTCESRNTYICEAQRTPEGVRDITVKAKFTIIPIDYGLFKYSIMCDVSSQLNNYEDIRIYKEKKQASSVINRYWDGADVYYIYIMTHDAFSNISFWMSAVQDIGEYRCEVYSLSRGLIASDSVYTDVRVDQVIKYVGTFDFEAEVSSSVYIPFNFGYSTSCSGMTTFTAYFKEMLNYTEMELNLNSQTINTTLFLRGNLTEISNYGQRAEFTLFVIPSAEKVLTAQDEITLREEILAIIKIYTSNPDPSNRKRRGTRLFQIDHGSVELYSTVTCSSDVYISVLDTNITFVPVQLGDVILSEEICITDLEPLVSAKCKGGEGKRTYVGEINVNQKCVFNAIPQLRDDRNSIIRDLSKIPVNESNAVDIAAQTGNLMMDEGALTTSDIIYIGVILNRIAQVRNVDESTLDSVVNIVYNVLEAPQERLVMSQDYGSAGNRILESFERIASNTMQNNSTYTRLNERFAVNVRDIIPTEEPVIGIKLEYSSTGVISNDNLQTFGSKTNINVGKIDAAIVLPESVVKGRNNTRLVLQVYADTSLFITRKQNRRYAIRGKVVAATVLVDGAPIHDLGDNNVKSIFTPSETDDKLICGFWNYSLYENSGGWATDGCMLKDIEDGRYVCECDHLTNFAILVDISGQDDVIDKGNTLALSIITIFGLALSLIGLGLTIISFLLFKNMRKGRGQQTLFNLAVAMVCYIIVFLAGSEQTQSYGGCITVAVLLHYFILAAFMWMLVEGVLQYLRFVKVLGTYIPNFMWKAAISAWGFPLIPVIIVLAVNYDSYRGGNSYCWMDRTPFYFAFLLPVCLILSANFIIFALVLKNILQRPKGLQSNQSQCKQAMMSLRAGVAVLVVLGLTWLFGFLAISGGRLTFLYIFTILNVLQGFLIFILFVAREKQFLKNWRTLCCKKKGSMYRPHSSEDSKTNPATKMNRFSSKSTSITNMDPESKDDNGETTLS